ncbi:hypothetical protein JVU11DRAFT_9435 [Chiua virens]|nr:hypothetical protein JVU11DRAFT_9435 [Chiua virens]
MDPTLMQRDLHSSNSGQRTPTVLSPSPVITPTKFKSRDLLADLAGWSSYPDMTPQAPGSENGGGLHQSGNLTSEMPSGMTHTLGGFRKASHLPTPQSPGNMESYLLTRTPTLQNDTHSTVLPTEFRSHVLPSPPPFQPRSMPTPEPSPLTARTRHSGLHSLSQPGRTNSRDDNDRATLSNMEGVQSRASTSPRTRTRQVQTRPVPPVSRSRLTSPIQWRPPEHLLPDSPHPSNSCLNNSSTSLLSQSTKDGLEAEATRIRVEPSENYLATAETAELRRPDYLKRTRRLVPLSSTGTGEASLASELGGKDESLLWSSANVGVVDSPVRGKRIALFQETSEESFEESLMAGGYGRYRSDRSKWKHDEDAEVPNQLDDPKGEEGLGSELALTEEEKRKKTRLAAFLDPPRVPSSAPQLFPVEIEGCGRVLMKVESSEPHPPPRPTPKAKRSRKRKKASADMKQGLDKDSFVAPEEHEFDGPNWPDAEFPWRSRSMTRGGLSSAEQEERLRFIESFLDRDSDEDEVEEGHSSSSRRSPDEASSRSPRSGGGKKYPASLPILKAADALLRCFLVWFPAIRRMQGLPYYPKSLYEPSNCVFYAAETTVLQGTAMKKYCVFVKDETTAARLCSATHAGHGIICSALGFRAHPSWAGKRILGFVPTALK